ncbi:MAG: hypothetical protein AAF799_22270 [Myxococcota bacterium]
MTRVILVGDGVVARRWAALIERSPRLELARHVALRDLDAALEGTPDATVAAAVPPRAALEVVQRLIQHERAGLVPSPWFRGLARMVDNDGPAKAWGAIQVASGWNTLPGVRWLSRQVAGARHVSLEIGGVPGCDDGDLWEVLTRAAAVLRRWTGDGRVTQLRSRGTAELEFTVEGRVSANLRLRTQGPRLSGVVDGAAGRRWRLDWQPDRETRERSAGRREADRHVPDADVRALHQLLDPNAAGGDSLRRAADDARWMEREFSDLRLPISRRALAHSTRIRGQRPTDLPGALGLRGPALDAPTPADALSVELPTLPLELAALRAGIKPVAFLTLKPSEEAAVRDAVTDFTVERRERGVLVEAQDQWIDDRDRGERRVELYISADPDAAATTARLQAEGDPSRSITELGALMGYPACCVQAFASLDDRSNNSRNRYWTAACTEHPGPWPWELNNLFATLVPFFPCSYRCEAALAYARATLAEAEREQPGLTARLRHVLARPVLYFDHEHQVVIEPTAEYDGSPGPVPIAGATVPTWVSAAMARFARAIGASGRLELTDAELRLGTQTLHRTDPALGLVAPFGTG